MKSIALLTMVFLPATFFSVCLCRTLPPALSDLSQALFSTTFFTFGENGSWEVSSMLWIYWATTVPATIVIVFLSRTWLARSDIMVHSLEAGQKWPEKLWKAQGKQAKPKAEQA